MSGQGNLRKYGTELLIGLMALLIVAAVMEYLLKLNAVIFDLTAGMIALLTVVIFIRLLLSYGNMWTSPDERMKKARAKAYTVSWYLIVAFITLLRVGDSIFKLDLTADHALMYALLVAFYSFIFLSWHYGRKADVELT